MRKQSQLFEEVVRDLIGVFAVERPHIISECGELHIMQFKTKYDWLYIDISDRKDFIQVGLMRNGNVYSTCEIFNIRQQLIDADMVIRRANNVGDIDSYACVESLRKHIRTLKKVLA